MKKLFLCFCYLCHSCLAAQTADSTAVAKAADSLFSIATTALDAGKPLEAQPPLEQAEILIREQIGAKNGLYWDVLQRLSVCLLTAGHFDQAEKYSLESKALAESLYGTRHVNYGKSLFGLGRYYLNRRQVAKAEPLLTESLTIFEKGTLEYANALDQLSVAHILTGRFESGEPLIREAVAIKEKLLGREDPSFLNTYTNLSNLYNRLARQEEAEQIYLEIRQIRKKTLGVRHMDYALTTQNLASIYADMGRFEDAERMLVEVLDVLRESLGKDHPKCATVLYNLGLVYFKVGRTDAAETVLLECKTIRAKTFGADNVQYANALMVLGNVYNEQKRYTEAETSCLEAIRIYEIEPTPDKRPVQYAKALQGLAYAHVKTGQMARVEALLLQAKAINDKRFSRRHPDYTAVIWSLADCYEQLGDIPKAVEYYLDGLRLMDEYCREAERYFSENDLLALYALQTKNLNEFYTFTQKHPEAPELADYAFNFALNYKNALLENTIRLQKALQEADAVTNAQYREWISLHRRLAGEYAQPRPNETAVAALEEQANLLEKSLIRHIGSLSGSETRYRWEQIRDKLQEDEAAIEFVQFQDKSDNTVSRVYCGALLIRKNSEHPVLIPLFEHAQVGNLSAIRHLYELPKPGNTALLYHLIGKPLAPQLDGVKTLYYSAAGLLHRINLGAVPLTAMETFGERFNLHNLGGTRQLITDNTGTPAHASPGEALIFGGIEYHAITTEQDFDAPADEPEQNAVVDVTLPMSAFRALRENSWPFLPWTLEEAKAVDTVLERSGIRSRIYGGLEATEDVFKQTGTLQHPAPRVLHLATHGFFFPDADSSATTGFRASEHPLIRSGLILSGANAAWQGENSASGREDGILTAYEIARMNLSNTELVVLSACETGLGELKDNEGVYGLVRAFKMAGAGYILMSLWNVSDRHTYEFMTCFYREWLERGLDIPEAFQSAQNRLRRQYAKPDNPALWAGFILIH